MPANDTIRVAVCGSDESARTGVASRLRGAAVESFAHAPNERFDVIALLRGTPAEVEAALSGGARVALVADPVPGPAECERLFAAARERGVSFAATNPDRYLPSRQLVRRQLDDGLGAPGLIRVHRWEAVSSPADPTGLPEPLLRDLDVVLWLAGRRPERVYAVAQQSDDTPGRYIQVHLGFPDGAMALLDYDDRLPPGDGYQSLSVIAASGAAHADDHQNAQLAFRGGHPQAVRTEERAGQLAALVQEFVDARRDGRDVTDENERGWRDVFAVAGAVRESLAGKRAVAVGGG